MEGMTRRGMSEEEDASVSASKMGSYELMARGETREEEDEERVFER